MLWNCEQFYGFAFKYYYWWEVVSEKWIREENKIWKTRTWQKTAGKGIILGLYPRVCNAQKHNNKSAGPIHHYWFVNVYAHSKHQKLVHFPLDSFTEHLDLPLVFYRQFLVLRDQSVYWYYRTISIS